MRTSVRLVSFAAALVAIFVLALIGARTVVPTALAQDWRDRGDHSAGQKSGEESGGDPEHTAEHRESGSQVDRDPSAPSPSSAPGEPGHEGHDSAPAPDSVRGLSVAQDGYRLESVSAPREVGRDGRLSFELTDRSGRPVTDYRTSHDKELHLIVVRSDGRYFRHVHPTRDDGGSWSIPWRWTAAGSYRLYADFVPEATGTTLTLTSTAEVAGDLTPLPLGADTDRSSTADYAVSMSGTAKAGRSTVLTFTVTRAGRPVTTLQPYLGASGHLVALRAGDLAYLHVHPTEESSEQSGPDVSFATQFPTAGRYLLYLDFSIDDQVHTATFVTTATR